VFACDESARGGGVIWASIGRLRLTEVISEGVVGFCFPEAAWQSTVAHA
jgi:hypothetical protein